MTAFYPFGSLFKNVAFFILLILASCQTKDSGNARSGDQPDKNSYTDTTTIRYAKGFSIDYHDHYKLVTITDPFAENADTSRYVLLDRGSEKPKNWPGAQVIEIPIRNIIATSSTHIGLLEFLKAENIITGLASLQYVYSPRVAAAIKAGKITEIGKNQGLNEEKLVEMHPDLIMTMGSPGAKTDHYATLRQAGIPILTNSEWVERTPLARAEWVKLVAALLNKEKLVNELFGKVEHEYLRLSALAGKAAAKPSVISGLNTKDAWFMPGGQSYMAGFFRDAGAAYHWGATKDAGSVSLNFESVYPQALEADIWLNVGFNPDDSKQSILSMDSRYADFKAFKSGRMYSYNNRVSESGSNDFFESGIIAPHVILADLIRIIHPEVLPDHQLVFYKKLN